MISKPLNNLLHSPGRLCTDPTDLSIAYPHGGTALGIIRSVAVEPGFHVYMIKAEEYASAVVEAVLLGESYVLSLIIRGIDDPTVKAMYPNTRVGAVTGHRVIESPDPRSDTAFRAGRRLSDRAVTLFFSPDDQTEGRAVLMHKAMPMLEEAAELSLTTKDEYELAAVWHTIPIEAGKAPYQEGLIQDIMLP